MTPTPLPTPAIRGRLQLVLDTGAVVDLGDLDVPIRVSVGGPTNALGHAPGVRSAGGRSTTAKLTISASDVRGALAHALLGRDGADTTTDPEDETDVEPELGSDTDPDATAAAHAARPLGGTVLDALNGKTND